MNEFFDAVVRAWTSAPPAARATIVLVAGLVAARLARAAAEGFLRLVRFDRLCERLGVADFLRKGKARRTATALVGIVVFWAGVLAVLACVSSILGLGVHLVILDALGQALPRIAAALIVLAAGLLAAAFVANFAQTIALNASFPHARLLARSVRVAGAALSIASALAQLGIGQGIIEFAFGAILAGVGLAAAIAFGLGCKDMARDTMARFLRNMRERAREGQGSDLEG